MSRGIDKTQRNVFQNGSVQKGGLLRDKTNETPQRFHVDVFDVAAIEEDLTSIGIVESANQTGNCRLSTSRQSNDGSELAGFAVDGDAVQNGVVRARRIREFDIAEG